MFNYTGIIIVFCLIFTSEKLTAQLTDTNYNEKSLIMNHAFFSDELRFDLVDTNQLKNYVEFTNNIFNNEYDTALIVLENLLNVLDSTVIDSNLNLPYFYPELSEIESINLSHRTKKEVLKKLINNLEKGNYSIHEKYLLSEYYFYFYCSKLYNKIWFYSHDVNVDIDYLSDVLMLCPTFAKIRFFDVELNSIFENYNIKIKDFPGSPKYIISKDIVQLWYDELNALNISKFSYQNNEQKEVFELSHEIFLSMLKQVLNEKDTTLIFKI